DTTINLTKEIINNTKKLKVSDNFKLLIDRFIGNDHLSEYRKTEMHVCGVIIYKKK
ncbi:8923_t:CDS:1, partial [Racocetra fulgida]